MSDATQGESKMSTAPRYVYNEELGMNVSKHHKAKKKVINKDVSRGALFLMCMFLGGLGIHRMYSGHVFSGFMVLLTSIASLVLFPLALVTLVIVTIDFFGIACSPRYLRTVGVSD